MSALQELIQKRDEAVKASSLFWDKHPDDNLTSAEMSEIKSIHSSLEEINKQLADTQAAADLRSQHTKAHLAPAPSTPFSSTEEKKFTPEEMQRIVTEAQRHGLGSNESASQDITSISKAFVENDELKAWMARIAPHGHLNEQQRIGESPAVNFGSMIKALVTGASATSGGALVRRDYAPLVDLPFRPLTLRDVITVGQTGSDLIEYPRVTGYTNNAAIVAEATSLANGTKPESALALEKVTTSVKTIAHWIPATKRALADAGQIRTLIDNFLTFGLEDVLERQIIAGDGTGENMTGILNTPGTTNQAWDTDMLTTARKAVTKARIVGRAQNIVFLMNPLDWEKFDLLKDNEGRFYTGGPVEMANPRLWGRLVVESEAVPVGQPIVGDLRQIVLWDREQSNIRFSDSHADFFIKNLVAILAEMRAAMGVFRPAAIVEFPMAGA